MTTKIKKINYKRLSVSKKVEKKKKIDEEENDKEDKE